MMRPSIPPTPPASAAVLTVNDSDSFSEVAAIIQCHVTIQAKQGTQDSQLISKKKAVYVMFKYADIHLTISSTTSSCLTAGSGGDRCLNAGGSSLIAGSTGSSAGKYNGSSLIDGRCGRSDLLAGRCGEICLIARRGDGICLIAGRCGGRGHNAGRCYCKNTNTKDQFKISAYLPIKPTRKN